MTKTVTMPMPVDYSKPATPENYVCGKCSADGVKLYRDYNTFLNHQTLLCCACACKEQKKEIIEGKASQIGWRIAAIPTEEGDTFWGYTSVPEPGCRWWYDLPQQVIPKKRVKNET